MNGKLHSKKKDFTADLTTSCSQTAPCWLYCCGGSSKELCLKSAVHCTQQVIFFNPISQIEKVEGEEKCVLIKTTFESSFISCV